MTSSGPRTSPQSSRQPRQTITTRWPLTPELALVVVATPNHAHAEPAIAALEHGKAVFVEKPLAVELVDAQNMIASADASGSPLMVGHIMRMMPGVRRLADLLASGELGEVAAIETSRSRWIDTDGADPQWWKLDKSRTGGELTHEIHELDLMCWLGGEVTAVSSIATADDGFRNTVVSFAGGAIGQTHHLDAFTHFVVAADGRCHRRFGPRGLPYRPGSADCAGDRSWSRGPIFDVDAENQSFDRRYEQDAEVQLGQRRILAVDAGCDSSRNRRDWQQFSTARLIPTRR